jgi:hypothetical protein
MRLLDYLASTSVFVLIGLVARNASFVPNMAQPKVFRSNSLARECQVLQRGEWRRVVARVQLIYEKTVNGKK